MGKKNTRLQWCKLYFTQSMLAIPMDTAIRHRNW